MCKLKVNLAKLLQTETTESGQLKELMQNPNCLVVKYIRHMWTEESGDVWYDGFVCGIVDGSEPAEFQIVYLDSDSGPVFLEVDEIITGVRNGDVVILWE